MREGGGTSRPSDRPARTASSQPTASTAGTSSPRSGRAKRARPLLREASRAVTSSMPVSMDTTVIKPSRKARRRSVRRHREVLVVDQVVEHLFHIDVGRYDARLLQGDASGEDRVALLRADLVVGEPRALLELLVDDRVCQLGEGAEGGLPFV